jgi:hypothetical protein
VAVVADGPGVSTLAHGSGAFFASVRAQMRSHGAGFGFSAVGACISVPSVRVEATR